MSPKNKETKSTSPESKTLNEQPKGIVGKLLNALKQSMNIDTKDQLLDELTHKTENNTGPNPFEKAKNGNEFDQGTLIKFMVFAAFMLMNKDGDDHDATTLGNLAEDEVAKKKAEEKISFEGARKMFESAEITGLGKRVVETVHKVTSGLVEKFIPKDCGKWANKIYSMSGLKPKRVWPSADQLKVVKGTNGEKGHSKQIYDLKSGNLPEGENEALELVSPGDWVMYFNNNGYCKNTSFEGQHSSIFLGWIDKTNRIARMASGSGGQAGREQTINLGKKPITRILKPQIA